MELKVEGSSKAEAIIGFGYSIDGSYKLFSKDEFVQKSFDALKQKGLFIEQEGYLNQILFEDKLVFFSSFKKLNTLRKGQASAAQSPRIAGSKIYDKVKDYGSAHIDFSNVAELAVELGIHDDSLVEAFALGFLLSSYEFNHFKSKPQVKALNKVDFVGLDKRFQAILDDVQIKAQGNFYTRDLASYPSNVANSEFIKNWAVEKGKQYGFKVSVLDEKDLKKLKMGGILGVNQGSENPPYIVTCHYRPPSKSSEKPRKKVLFVGKGVTFDTGGYSIKPAASMLGMKYDMHGSASVLGAMTIISQLKPDVEAIGMIGLVENMINGKAMRPGDIITHYDGTTVEVGNTDAEGRLVLADVLSYGVAQHKPDVVVDIATLTGACNIAIGHQAIALMSNNNAYAEKMLKMGQETGEVCWELPTFEAYADLMKSPIADMSNISSIAGTAGTITAGKFLEHFVKETPWIHLDIASTANIPQDFDYRKKGITGIGARLLSEFAQCLSRELC